jgi:transketolase
MRRTFAETLAELAADDPRIVLLTGDLGYMALDPFIEKHPERFINVGVAEQNMVGIATGMAEAGFVPFVYSIVNFATMRPFEFIRNGPVAHGLPVRIVGVGGGIEYSTNGLTHYGLEDIGILRTQPGLAIVAPADHQQTRAALRATFNLPGPVYYRLGKDDKAVVPGLDGAFAQDSLQIVRTGQRACIVALGSIAIEAVAAADLLSPSGITPTVAVAAHIAPPPVQAIADLLERHDVLVTVEAHYVNGGLGSLVCEVAAERHGSCRVIRLGLARMPDGHTGSQRFMYDLFGISAEAIARTVVDAVKEQR